MRVIFSDAAYPDNLPEIEKRQYENKFDHRTTRKQNLYRFFRRAKYNARLTRYNNRKMPRTARMSGTRERIAGMPEDQLRNLPHAGAVARRRSRAPGFLPLRTAGRDPDFYRLQRRRITAPAAIVGF